MRSIGMKFAAWMLKVVARMPEWVYGRKAILDFFLLYLIINSMAGMNKR